MGKLIYLFTETVKNGIYSAEYKPYTIKQFNKMCKTESSDKNKKLSSKKK